MELRPYQKDQLIFIQNKLPGKLPIAIESPTGSGKTFVILSFIKDYFEKHKDVDTTIVITTGFNKLVYQMKNEAIQFGLDPIVLVGQDHLNCGYKIKISKKMKTFPTIDEYDAFSENNIYKHEPGCMKKCQWKDQCLFTQLRNKMKNFGPKLIITNHSLYLIYLNNGMLQPDITFVDEAHTFSSFYESYLSNDISAKEIKYIQKILNNDNDPTALLFKHCIEKKFKFNVNLFNTIREKIEKNNSHSGNLIKKLADFSNTKPSIDNFIDISDKGISITKFWSIFDVKQSDIRYVLFSATMDEFTTEMFSVPRNRIYRENKCNTIDYKQSEFIIVDDENFKDSLNRFLSLMKLKNCKKGLILSTTNKDVKYMIDMKNICGYKVVTDIKMLDTDEDVILVGSRALFQGVDIPGLNFVGLNKIPFPNFDEKFKAQIKYLNEVAQMNPWTQFTIPLVKNSITQSTGRLWRHPGDKGYISIFDKRLLERFGYMIHYISNTRKGIKVKVLSKDLKEIDISKYKISNEEDEDKIYNEKEIKEIIE
jgi:Rad3-related DNA helicase